MTERTRDPEVEAFLAVSAARLAPRTVDAYRRDLAALTDFLDHKPSTATGEELERYVAELRARGLAATTIARRMKPSRDDPTAVGTSDVADAIIEQMGVMV